jgi:hypothetical protein
VRSNGETTKAGRKEKTERKEERRCHKTEFRANLSIQFCGWEEREDREEGGEKMPQN